jgi:hypothetical protein
MTYIFRLSDLGLKPCRFINPGKFGRTLEGVEYVHGYDSVGPWVEFEA